jgi:HNH endonuclease
VIGMPLAKLQKFGEGRNAVEDRFIYDFTWSEEVKRPAVERTGFDDRLYLRSSVGEWLVRLTPLLRPLIEAKWTKRVAERNPEFIDHQLLDGFLFGAERINLNRVRAQLLELQGGNCFYCFRRIRQAAEVDHFLPWSRHPDNTLDNLVAAHRLCNEAKSASIAGLDHLEHWLARSRERDNSLAELASKLSWPRKRDRTIATARAVYLWLPSQARLWIAGTEFEAFDITRARALLAA